MNDSSLEMVTDTISKQIFLYFYSAVSAQQIYRDAYELDITGKGYAWIVTEQALTTNAPEGKGNSVG